MFLVLWGLIAIAYAVSTLSFVIGTLWSKPKLAEYGGLSLIATQLVAIALAITWAVRELF